MLPSACSSSSWRAPASSDDRRPRASTDRRSLAACRAHRARGADQRRRLHGRLPARSRARLLPHAGRDRAAGDFITAPEISQVFGELIGLWCAVVWRLMGEPARLRLVELGPGRGTLMRDVLRAARTVPAFHAALEVELVESNETLARSSARRWSRRARGCAGAPSSLRTRTPSLTIVIANEFLDTLPVEQWVVRGGRWLQRRVGLDAAGQFVFVDGEPDAGMRPPQVAAAAAEGDVLETRAAAFAAWSAKLAALGHRSPRCSSTTATPAGAGRNAAGRARPSLRGCAGGAGRGGPDGAGGLRSLRRGRRRRAGLACDGPVTQAEFLGALGITERASRLMAANPARAAAIEGDVARLMAPNGMGGRFQAIGVRSRDVPPLPGLATMDSGACCAVVLPPEPCSNRSKPPDLPHSRASATGSSPAPAGSRGDLCEPQLRAGLGRRPRSVARTAPASPGISAPTMPT